MKKLLQTFSASGKNIPERGQSEMNEFKIIKGKIVV